MISHNEKLKQLPRPHKTPNIDFLPLSAFDAPTWPFWFWCKRLMWTVQMLICAPLKNVSSIDPAIPVIVPNTFIFPVTVLIFNFSKLQNLRDHSHLNYTSSLIIFFSTKEKKRIKKKKERMNYGREEWWLYVVTYPHKMARRKVIPGTRLKTAAANVADTRVKAMK